MNPSNLVSLIAVIPPVTSSPCSHLISIVSFGLLLSAPVPASRSTDFTVALESSAQPNALHSVLWTPHWSPRLTNLALVAVVRPCVSWLTISTYQCPRLSNHLLVNPHAFQERIGQSHQRDSHLIHFHISANRFDLNREADADPDQHPRCDGQNSDFHFTPHRSTGALSAPYHSYL
jgi:hypothetical protein